MKRTGEDNAGPQIGFFAGAANFFRGLSLAEWILIILGLWLIYIKAHITDDGYIYFRYVLNIWDGNGPVYNPGEFVEGYTSPLWLFLLASTGFVFDTLIADVYFIGLALGLASFLLIIYIHRLMAGRLKNPASYSPYVLALFVSFAPATAFFTSGLETPLVILYAVLYAIMVLEGLSSRILWAIIIAIGPVVRPELGIISLAGIAFFAARKRYKDAALMLAAFLIFNGLVEFFRIYYYAALLPNTGYVKSGLEADYWRGVDYYIRMTVYGLPWLFIASLGLSYLSQDEAKPGRLWLLLSALAMTFYMLRVGDYFHGRFMLVPYILILISLSGNIEDLAGRVNLDLSGPAWRLALPLTLFVFNFVHKPLEHRDISLRNPHGYVNDTNDVSPFKPLNARNYSTRENSPDMFFYKNVSERLGLDRRLTVITHPIASEFYSYPVNFIHFFGLTDNVISHVDNRTYLEGHDKSFLIVIPYLLYRDIDFINSDLLVSTTMEWMNMFSVQLQLESLNRPVKKKATLLSFTPELLANLYKVSPVTGEKVVGRINAAYDYLLKKENYKREECEMSFFLSKKADGILGQARKETLDGRYNAKCSDDGGFGRYTSKHGGLINDLLMQSRNTHNISENFSRAIRLHNKKIPPYLKGWLPGTGLNFTVPRERPD
ncbi:MAG: hypothetical protein HY887_08865 [Deltaproteobacteria bacterium]|nr:hypothetical protein [Deltaproteobacteria bacterium]